MKCKESPLGRALLQSLKTHQVTHKSALDQIRVSQMDLVGNGLPVWYSSLG